MEAEYKKLKINELKPNTYNPNEMSQKMGEHLVKEIERVGFLQPILINKNNMIIDGEHRWLAAKEQGLEEIPVIQIDVDDKTAKTITVNMNQIKGEVNPVKFAELLKDLKIDFNISELSSIFNMDELEIENYDTLINLPEFNDKDLNLEKKSKEVVCPNCGHEFNI